MNKQLTKVSEPTSNSAALTRSELVAHFPEEEADANVAHEFVESFLGLQSPSAEKRRHDYG